VMDIKPSNYDWKRYADHFVRELLCNLDTITTKTLFLMMFTNFNNYSVYFYRAMHVVQARYCYLMSSVRDVDVPWAYRFD